MSHLRFHTTKRLAALAVAVGLGLGMAGCAELALPPTGTCGNGIVEDEEACEPSEGDPGCGALEQGALACRFICLDTDCPPGMGCGVDGECRAPTWAYTSEADFELPAGPAIDLQAGDLDLDGREELVVTARASEDLDTGSVLSTHRSFVVSTDGIRSSVPLGGVPAIGQLEPDEPWIVMGPTDPGQNPEESLDVKLSGYGTRVFQAAEGLELRPVLIGGAVRLPHEASLLRLADLDARGSSTIDDRVVLALGAGQGLVVASQAVRADALNTRPEAWSGLDDELEAISLPQSLRGRPALGGPALASSGLCGALAWTDADGALSMAWLCDEAGAAPGLQVPGGGIEAGSGPLWEDANGDGLDDLTIVDAAGAIRPSYAVGDGTFHGDVATIPASSGDGSFGPAIGGGPFAALEDHEPLSIIDRNGDGIPDPITSRSFLPSCPTTTCDCGTHECRPSRVPAYRASGRSLVDIDGDGREELVAIATGERDEAWESLGLAPPEPGDLVIIGDPGTLDWSGIVVPLGGAHEVMAAGDLNADGEGDLVLIDRGPTNDGVKIAFGRPDRTVELVSVGELGSVSDAIVLPGAVWILSRADEGLADLTELRGVPGTRDVRVVSGSLGGAPGFGETGSPVRRLSIGRYEPDNAGGGLGAVFAVGFEPRAGAQPEGLVTLFLRSPEERFLEGERLASATSLFGVDAPIPSYLGSQVSVDLDGDGAEEVVIFGPAVARNAQNQQTVLGGRVMVLGLGVGTVVRHLSDFLPIDGQGLAYSVIEEVYAARPLLPDEPDYGGPGGDTPETFDVDGDGDEDVVLLTDEEEPRLAIWFNTGTVMLDPEARLLFELGGARGVTVERRIDAEGDSLPRLHVLVAQSNRTRRFEIDLEAQVVRPLESLDLPGADDVIMADLDGDGIRDVGLMRNGDGGPTVTWARGL